MKKVAILFIILYLGSIAILPKLISKDERLILIEYKYCYPKLLINNRGLKFKDKCVERRYAWNPEWR